jgi:2-oxo-3-hexenedioate decarboxylase
MSCTMVEGLAQELYAAYSGGRAIAPPPSQRDPGFSVEIAYQVEAELRRLRVADGHAVVGRKVGFANKAMWRVLKLQTLVWAAMYDDTVQIAGDDATWKPHGYSLKIEPEIVVKLKQAVPAQADAAAVLGCVEWLALGFEIIDCPYPEWQFTAADFIAAFGLHRKLVVGTPLMVELGMIPDLVDQLAGFRVQLFRGDELVEEGAGKNSLRSPALCVAELAGATPLGAGEIISTGTLSNAPFIAEGQTWRARADILPVAPVALRLV